jgi:hypothetical protein
VQPYYNHWKWEEEAIKAEKLAESICEYKRKPSGGSSSRLGPSGSRGPRLGGAGSLAVGGGLEGSFGGSAYSGAPVAIGGMPGMPGMTGYPAMAGVAMVPIQGGMMGGPMAMGGGMGFPQGGAYLPLQYGGVPPGAAPMAPPGYGGYQGSYTPGASYESGGR